MVLPSLMLLSIDSHHEMEIITRCDALDDLEVDNGSDDEDRIEDEC